MEKTIPINPGEGNVYINADKDHDVKGSIPKADFFNQVEQELLNVITGYGLEASGEDTGQVKQAIDAAIAAASDGLIKTIRYQSLYQHLKSVENGVIKPEDEKSSAGRRLRQKRLSALICRWSAKPEKMTLSRWNSMSICRRRLPFTGLPASTGRTTKRQTCRKPACIFLPFGESKASGKAR